MKTINKKIYFKYLSNIKENIQIKLKLSKIKYNLLWLFLISLFSIISIQFIFNKVKLNKKQNKELFLRNTESSEYSIDKSISYEENGKKIYSQNKKINFNKLDKYYNGIKEPVLRNYNNIYITLCLNEEFHLLAAITIASILKNANKNSFIHFHIIALNNLSFKIMEKIYSIKSKINDNSEFIFYNGKKVEEDFKLGIKESQRGAIDYGRFLITEIVDDIDKIISLDIGDILVEKDLFELYNLNLKYYGYFGVEDAYPRCFLQSIFNHKEKYVNGGVLLINIKKWKEINLYQYIVKMFKYVFTKAKFYNPYTDIMNDFLPWGSTDFMNLKYNFPDYIVINKNSQKDYKIWTKECSYYYNKKEEIIEAEKNVVIRNLYNYKIYKGQGTKEMKKDWKLYAELTGFYEEICKKYNCP